MKLKRNCETFLGGGGLLQDTSGQVAPLAILFLDMPHYLNAPSQVLNATSSPGSSWKQVYTEEADSVFADDGNFEETETEVTVKDQFVASNPWKDDVSGKLGDLSLTCTLKDKHQLLHL